MGGTVAVTIRRENGELLKMARKTGSYSWMFTSKKFNNGKVDEAIDDYYKIFGEMKEDFESGAPYKFPMSPAYGWCNETNPVDYGLVFIDIMKKEIHSMQGYDSPGLVGMNEFSTHYINDKETDDALESLLVNNHLSLHIKDEDGAKKELGMVHDIFGHDINLKKMGKLLDDAFDDKGIIFDIAGRASSYNLKGTPIGLKDYKIVRYHETAEGLIEFARALTSNGIVFNDEEKRNWESSLNEDLEDYGLDIDCEDDNAYEKALEEKKAELRKELLAVWTETPQNKVKP